MSSANACVVYARTSTTDQHPENQIVALRRMAERRGMEICRIYVEQASGHKKRPVLDELLLDAHRGPPWSAVFVFALDRLGRRMMDVLQLVTRLDDLGIAVISHEEPWTSSSGAARKLMLSIAAWVLESEVERIRQRTKIGLEQARKRGVRLGRPPVSVDLERLVALRASGMSIRQVARALNIGAATAHRLLRAHETLEAACSENAPSAGVKSACVSGVEIASSERFGNQRQRNSDGGED
jgi:DNA invertase Pin-like site-specific DNA recombinase